MNRSTAAHPLLLALAGLPLALSACSSASPSAEPLGADRAPASAKKVRQVSVRSPYGHVAATKNLVLDGDLELEPDLAFTWYAVNPDYSLGTLTFKSGGQCRSGLYCGDAQAGVALYANYIAIRPGSAGTFTFAAQPASGACGDVESALLLSADAFGADLDFFSAQPDSASPGPDGWCTYTGRYTAEQPLYFWTQLVLVSASETVFDDAVVVEDPAMRETARRERRAGDPETGRKLAATRRAAAEARRRKEPESLK